MFNHALHRYMVIFIKDNYVKNMVRNFKNVKHVNLLYYLILEIIRTSKHIFRVSLRVSLIPFYTF